MRDSKLTNISQPLKGRCVYDYYFTLCQSDESMNCISDLKACVVN